MASPIPRSSPATSIGGSGRPAIVPATPAAGSLEDEAIWKRLREAGFDEESVKRRDKAALIAYITKLETEVYDYQYHMGILILEKKEWTSRYEQVKASAESAEIVYKRDQAQNLSALAESRKREGNLRKALSIEKECVTNIEKALHDIRGESAERQLASDSKLAEANKMMETAQKMFDEVEIKLHAAESLEAEASRFHDTALRNLQDVEAREDELRRRLESFKAECDAKEKEINLQRESLYDSQEVLHQEQARLLERQKLLNQREDYIFERLKELRSFEKELDKAKANLEEEQRALKEKTSSLDLNMAAVASREEAIVKRESLLEKRERELLILQEKIANREYEEIQKLADQHQSSQERKKKNLEAELEKKRMSFEDEIETKRAACEVREAELKQRENMIQGREETLELQLNALAEKQENLEKQSKALEVKEQALLSAQKAAELQLLNLHDERDRMKQLREDLEKIKGAVEEEKKQIAHAQEKLELTRDERSCLLVLETKLKEEIDGLRAQKMELMAEADKLQADKEKFEMEWELIEEKREELRRETERINDEKKAVSNYLKNERDSIKLEKDNLRNQFKYEADSLSREREEFISKMEHESSDLFDKILQEREDFANDIKIQRNELENCIEKRREELESYLREKEEAFEQERAKELRYISSQKELLTKELDHVASELRRLENERLDIARDRDQRETEWSEIKNSIEVLNMQREKLQKQRELLHADREKINQQIDHLKRLEDLDIELENRSLSEIRSHDGNSSQLRVPVKKCSNKHIAAQSPKALTEPNINDNGSPAPRLLPEMTADVCSPPTSVTLSWVKKCAAVIFRRSPEKAATNTRESFEGKISTKTGEEGNFPNTSALQNGKTGDEGGELEKMGRSGMTKSVQADVEKSNARLTLLTNKVEDRNIIDNNISKLREDAAHNMSFNISKSIHRAVFPSLLGRKRLNNLLSQDHADDANAQLEPSLKSHKRLRQEKFDDVQGATSNCMLSTQMPDSVDECGPTSEGCIDKEHECPKTSSLQPPEVSPDGLISHSMNAEKERQDELGNLVHVGNGELSSASYLHGMLKTQGNLPDSVSLDIVLEDEDGYDQDSDDEVNEEEEQISLKKKLWNFLIT